MKLSSFSLESWKHFFLNSTILLSLTYSIFHKPLHYPYIFKWNTALCAKKKITMKNVLSTLFQRAVSDKDWKYCHNEESDEKRKHERVLKDKRGRHFYAYQWLLKWFLSKETRKSGNRWSSTRKVKFKRIIFSCLFLLFI